MLDHERFLELAAAAIDFELSAAESADLARHLASCASCRRTAHALREEARLIAALPVRSVAVERSPRLLAAALRTRTRIAPLRLVAIAAILALAALAALTAGAEIIRRLQSQVVVSQSPGETRLAAPSAASRIFHSSEFGFLVPFRVELVGAWDFVHLADYNTPQQISFMHTGPSVQVDFTSLAETHISDGNASSWAQAEPWPAQLNSWLAGHADLKVVQARSITLAGLPASVTDIECVLPGAPECSLAIEPPNGPTVGILYGGRLRVVEVRTRTDQGLVIGFSSTIGDFDLDAARLDALLATLAFEPAAPA